MRRLSLALVAILLVYLLGNWINQTWLEPQRRLANQATATPVPMVQMQPTFTPTEPPTVTATASATKSPTPTATRRPMQTASPTPTLPPTATATPRPTATPLALTGEISGDRVNLRAGPDTTFDRVGQVTLSQTVRLLNRTAENDWWQIETETGEQAWISAEFVTLDAPLEAVTRALSLPPTATSTATAVATTTPPALLTSTVTISPALASLPAEGEVNADAVNLRREATTDSDVIGLVLLGDSLTVVDRNEDSSWLAVTNPYADDETDPATVWIAAEFVDVLTTTVQTLTSTSPATPTPTTTISTATATATATPGQAERVARAEADLAMAMSQTENASVTLTPTPTAPTAAAAADTLTDSIATTPTVTIPSTNDAAPTALPPVDIDAQAVAATSGDDLPPGGAFGPPGDINPLTGLPLATDKRNLRPVITCINNDPASRPQFGTSQADVMYEYLMEGYGITRFSGVFYGDTIEQIGPVRSARLINFYMGALYNAPVMCSGASDQVRFLLKNQAPFAYFDIDLDDPSNTRYSASIGTDYRTRLRTSSAGHRNWLADWEIEAPAAVRGFTFGNLPPGGQPAVQINIPYPGSTGSNVAYSFDPNRGQYLRFLDDVAHTDGNTGQQLALDNVVVQFVAHQATDIVEDSLGSTSIRLNLFGSGTAIVFRDGQAFAGTWRSETQGDTPRFFALDGSEIALKPGRTWISIVPPSYDIAF